MTQDPHPLSLDQHSIFNTSNKLSPPTNRVRSLLKVHRNEIFLACGRTIRYGDLRRPDDYVELRGLDINFEIEIIELNSSRGILLVCGKQSVIAVVLPHASLLAKGTAVRSYLVGAAHHQKCAIAQVRFHPLSSSDDCVVILTDDSYIRLYDLSASFDTPDLTIDLLDPTTRQQLSRGGIGDLDALRPVAFTFGLGGHGWTAFAILVLTSDGDVYAVTPVLPHSITIEAGALARFEQYAVQGSVTTAAIYAKICSAIDQGTRTSTGISFRTPTRLSAPVVVGPLLFDPVPLEFSNSLTEPNDIILLPGRMADVLVIASRGKLDVALMIDDMVLKAGAPISCAVIESVNAPEVGSMTLVPSMQDDACLIVSADRIHELTVRHGGPSALADDADETLPTTSLQMMIDCEKSVINGYQLIEHDLDHYLAVILLDYDALVVLDHEDEVLSNLSQLHIPASGAAAADEAQDPDDTVTTQTPRYQSLITRPLYKPQLASRSILPVIPASLAKQKIQITSESLRMLGKVAVQLREDMEQLHRATIAMHRRLELQVGEVDRQRKKCSQLTDKLDSVAVAKGVEDRLVVVKERQAELVKRSTKLLSDLMKETAPKLTAAEVRYFQELKRVRDRLHGSKGLVGRADGLERQFKDVASHLAPQQQQEMETAAEQDTQSPMRSSQLAKLNAQLAAVEETIERAKARCGRLSKAVGLEV